MDEDIVHSYKKLWEKVRECDVLIALHKHSTYRLTQMKYILARINHTDDTYFYPDANLNVAKFGAGIEWDETLAENIAIQKGLYKIEERHKADSDSFMDGKWY